MHSCMHALKQMLLISFFNFLSSQLPLTIANVMNLMDFTDEAWDSSDILTTVHKT